MSYETTDAKKKKKDLQQRNQTRTIHQTDIRENEGLGIRNYEKFPWCWKHNHVRIASLRQRLTIWNVQFIRNKRERFTSAPQP